MATVIGGASSYFQTDEYVLSVPIEASPLPSLYDADIDSLSEGLRCKTFTSVDLDKVGLLDVFRSAAR